MNAIVVFTPARDAQSLTEQTATLGLVDLWQQRTESGNTKALSQQSADRDQPALPLWTWFTENPRRCGA